MHYSPEATAKAQRLFQQAQRKETQKTALRMAAMILAFLALFWLFRCFEDYKQQDFEGMPLQQTIAVVEGINGHEGAYTGERSVSLLLSSSYWPQQTVRSNIYLPVKTKVRVFYRRGRSGNVSVDDVQILK